MRLSEIHSNSNFDIDLYLKEKNIFYSLSILRFSKKFLRVCFKMVRIKILKWGKVYDEKNF
ncbi:hypothetical protein LEP1GSC115_4148 [Leptospira interrogans serovar Australis str. 200703203]|uniref:Uncharacterized protein n=1 Tax=Leptospira interrogans serovar Australis str. 200703203 TaxID=1085541 RepID=N1URT8_LEPIR|nr:hypothetical protein LEP1GSC007_2686 [Leptospira interrogans serovar Bulgarica str. Mallika]EMY24600.1 hypothetical protein LEP1GSC115_4148 [Leptospira interrogans serovar Australis str. 200703203]